ncbi:hypothetical protein TH2_05228 [Thalassospira profundimaris WP0211]|nr:hypothetical protein TH2_05228 [Thalassospira profundimaris WP0211]
MMLKVDAFGLLSIISNLKDQGRDMGVVTPIDFTKPLEFAVDPLPRWEKVPTVRAFHIADKRHQ